MADFPTLSDGSLCMYPVTISKVFPVKVVRYASGREQRWQTGKSRAAFTLTIADATLAEKTSIDNFFRLVNGTFGQNWSIEVPQENGAPQVYQNCAFADKRLSWTADDAGYFSTEIKITQVKA